MEAVFFVEEIVQTRIFYIVEYHLPKIPSLL